MISRVQECLQVHVCFAKNKQTKNYRYRIWLEKKFIDPRINWIHYTVKTFLDWVFYIWVNPDKAITFAHFFPVFSSLLESASIFFHLYLSLKVEVYSPGRKSSPVFCTKKCHQEPLIFRLTICITLTSSPPNSYLGLLFSFYSFILKSANTCLILNTIASGNKNKSCLQNRQKWFMNAYLINRYSGTTSKLPLWDIYSRSRKNVIGSQTGYSTQRENRD